MAKRGTGKGHKKGGKRKSVGRSKSKKINWETVMKKVREGKRLTKREREFLSRALDRRKKARDER